MKLLPLRVLKARRIPRNLALAGLLICASLSLGWSWGGKARPIDVFGGVKDNTTYAACPPADSRALADISVDLVHIQRGVSTILAQGKTDVQGIFAFRQSLTKKTLEDIDLHAEEYQLVLSKKPFFENLVEPKVGRYLATKVEAEMPRMRIALDGALQVTVVSSSDTQPLLDRVWMQLLSEEGETIEKEGLVDTQGRCRVLFGNIKPGKYRVFAQSYNFTPFFGSAETICPGVIAGYNNGTQEALAYRMNPNYSNSAEVDTLSVGTTLKIPPIEY